MDDIYDLVGSIFDFCLEISLGSPTRWEAVTGSLPMGVMEVNLVI